MPPASSAPQPHQRPKIIPALSRVMPFIRPVIGRFIAGIATALVAAVVALLIPVALRWLVDGPLTSGDQALIWIGGIAILLLGLTEALFVFLRRLFVTLPSTAVEATMRQTLYAKLQRLPIAFHDRWQSGQLLSRAVGDLGMMRRFFAFGAVIFITNLLTLVIGLGILLAWSPLLGALFIVTSIPIVVIAFRFEQSYHQVARRAQDQQGDLATAVEQSVHGIRVLKAFGRGRTALEGFERQAEALRSTELTKARSEAMLWMWLTIIPFVSYAVCLVVGIWLVAEGQLTVGELVGFLSTAVVLNWPIESLGFLFAFAIDAANASVRLFEVLDAEEDIVDPEEPRTIAVPRGRLVFDDVHFRYQDAASGERDLVDGATLAIEPGETMALVGVTGSGKTTLTALPGRLYDVTDGRVTLDGVDVRDLTLEELRTHVAMAFEDATLFSASVRDNVLMGARERTDEVVAEALQVAQASFVHDLPEGLDTTIGEEGLSLSGGQRQRLALARAVAAKPAVLVLDDPLSALDVETEALVEDALRHVLASTTALIVAHRPSTVQLADRVALMRDGRIDDVGTHSELLARNDHYVHVIASLEEAQRDRQDLEQVATGAFQQVDASVGAAPREEDR
ncbi:ABC transporter ATP-binding protein/permease [Agrococcus terreus]|uniref:ABC transporter ATP-binding protein n=1 Tax=Agrococcus terreus TaxID=574649 RepID=UPI00384E592E